MNRTYIERNSDYLDWNTSIFNTYKQWNANNLYYQLFWNWRK